MGFPPPVRWKTPVEDAGGRRVGLRVGASGGGRWRARAGMRREFWPWRAARGLEPVEEAAEPRARRSRPRGSDGAGAGTDPGWYESSKSLKPHSQPTAYCTHATQPTVFSTQSTPLRGMRGRSRAKPRSSTQQLQLLSDPTGLDGPTVIWTLHGSTTI